MLDAPTLGQLLELASPSLLRLLRMGGDEELLDRPALDEAAMEEACEALGDAQDAQDLRGARHRALAYCAAWELAGGELDRATACWSAAAAKAIHRVLSWQGLTQELGVLGLGKLGGGELNYCSDVDLVLVRREGSDEAQVERGIHRALETLQELTSSGFVVRVDLNLRPGGRTAKLCPTVGAAIESLLLYGRTWERAAWLRARPVAGNLELGQELLEGLTPWLYPRNLDFTTLDALREMKDRIDTTTRRREGWDVKLGRGGIREIEFLVQARQLTEAGKLPALRGGHTRRVLEALLRENRLDAEGAKRLDEAYVFFRHLEHALQLREQAQTQQLPDDPSQLAPIARALGQNLDAFQAELSRHRDEVGGRFQAFLEEPEGSKRKAKDPLALVLLGPFPVLEESTRVLEEAGFTRPLDAIKRLERLRSGSRRLSSSGQRHLTRAAPVLLDAVVHQPDPDEALEQVDALLERLGARATLLALLSENAATTRALVALLSQAPSAGATLLAHPELLDELVSQPHHGSTLEEHLEALTFDPQEPVEETLSRLRRYRHRVGLSLALAQLGGALDGLEAQRALALLADALLIQAAHRASHWESRYREAPAIVALGGLGGGGLCHDSDLDLIFVAPDTDPEELATRAKVARRIIAALDSPTREGRVFQVDLRLRPSGHLGPIVVSLPGWRAYLSNKAPGFERLALARARVVAGTDSEREAIGELIHQGLRGQDPTFLAQEVRHLRTRQLAELAQEGGGRYDLKYGPGGLAEAHFLAALVAARQEEPIARPADANWLRQGGEAEDLVEAILDLEAMESCLRLRCSSSVVHETAPTTFWVAKALGEASGEALISRMERNRQRIATALADHLEALL